MADPDNAPEPEDQDDDGRHKAPADTYASVAPAPLPAMAPDGGPAIGSVGTPAPLPAPTPDNFMCLRGPCRYYWQITTHLVSGNPAPTWDAEDGLRETMTCPTCEGRRQLPEVPPTAAQLAAEGADVVACGYIPSQGIHARRDAPDGIHGTPGRPCVLAEGHDGAHHHLPLTPPAPRLAPCHGCGGSGVVADPNGAPVREPRQITRTCLRQPGCETDFTEDVVYDCNLWDPMQPDDVKALDKRRRVYLKLYPQHEPKKD